MISGRVKVDKQTRKQRERKDSLDDISSGSSDEYVPVKRGKKVAQAKKEEVVVEVEEEEEPEVVISKKADPPKVEKPKTEDVKV